ncbi:MAG: 50S ribosomal protein L31 [Anaerolineae bacterium]|nr:50S ribosomal protein L31 [Anaerolineae bacterium]
MPKPAIHPKWFPEASVVCACGNSWVTGATQAEIRTDICSACHPFYTGEQRIVDTEGQVDRFMKRLQLQADRRAEVEAREASKTPLDLSLAELGLNNRFVTILSDANILVVQDFLNKLNEGEDSLLELPGIGRKVIADIKKMLRTRGYEVPATTAE